MAHIFISYSRVDQVYARSVADTLQARGFDVWIDDRIDYGDRWWQTIVAAIRDCGAFIVIMSPDAERSEWAEREILVAQREHKPIFPLLLRGREFALLITTQFADVTAGQLPPDDFYTRVRRVVTPGTEPGRRVIPESIPAPPARHRGRMRAWLLGLAVIAGAALLGIYLSASQMPAPTMPGDAAPGTTQPPPQPAATAVAAARGILIATHAGLPEIGGGRLAFCKDGNIHILDMATGQERTFPT